MGILNINNNYIIYIVVTGTLCNCSHLYSLTIVVISTGFLPKMSEEAPIIGEAKNCRKENSDPRRPVL